MLSQVLTTQSSLISHITMNTRIISVLSAILLSACSAAPNTKTLTIGDIEIRDCGECQPLAGLHLSTP